MRCANVLRGLVLLLFVSSVLSGLAPRPARAAGDAGIQIRAAELAVDGDSVLLDTAFQVDLGDTVEDALVRGIALNFVFEFELGHERWWTLGLWNRTVHEFEWRQRLTWNALTRQYRLADGVTIQHHDSLAEALAQLGRVRARRVAARDDLDAGRLYMARVRLRLDTSLLPKPVQINAIASRHWSLASDDHVWTFRR
jgi:hypothetical protein